MAPFSVRLRSNVATLARDLSLIYADFELANDGVFADFHVGIEQRRSISTGLRSEVRFFLDERPFFVPLSPAQSFAGLEWGLNWCVTSTAHQYLIFHAAVIEKNGRTALLPAPPGSGKSTLCAGLVMSGWRLLSDELALYDMAEGLVYGMARPINLKNRSIDVIQSFAPQAEMTVPVPNTSKGTVALLRPPRESVLRAREPARPSWVILPQYRPRAAAELTPYSPAKTFMLLAEQAFNYQIHGRQGFEAVGRLIDQTRTYQFVYSQLADAVATFNGLAEGRAP